MAWSPVHRVVRELAALPRQPGRPPPPRGLRRPAVPRRSRPTGRPASRSWDPDEWAARVRGHRGPLRRARHQAPRRLLPVADRRDQPAPARVGTAAATSSASWPRRCGARACASASTTRAGSTGRSNDRPIGSTAERSLAADPAGDYPAYAEAHVRELIERYRPSVLWNDIAWPGRLAALVPLVDDYRAAVPDGVVNDRWMPWSPGLPAPSISHRSSACVDRATAKAATKQAGSHSTSRCRAEERSRDLRRRERLSRHAEGLRCRPLRAGLAGASCARPAATSWTPCAAPASSTARPRRS